MAGYFEATAFPLHLTISEASHSHFHIQNFPCLNDDISGIFLDLTQPLKLVFMTSPPDLKSMKKGMTFTYLLFYS